MAMEMVVNPSILFLDEPTSGLDTFTAYSVISTLKDLAGQGRTVVATIHQPSSDIFGLFDDLLLLSEGKVVYYGTAKDSIEYFGKLGYKCPQYMNPSDYIFVSLSLHYDDHNLKL
jgi:ATP-binding cassette subfamily G (WHITE) protein 1